MLLRNSRSRGQAPADPLLKPTGTPTLNGSHAHNADNLLVVFDSGNDGYKILQDCSPGHAVYPPTTYPTAWNPSALPSVTTTPYGTGFKHPGAAAEESNSIAGFSIYVNDSDAIRTAHNLSAQGTGAAFCIEAVFVPHARPSSGVGAAVIFGRTARGFFEAAPYASVVFSFSSAGKAQLWFKAAASSTAYAVESGVLSLDVYHHLLATFKNDSAGSCTMKFYVDGSLVATSSGHALEDTFGNENAEGQVMMGSSPHIFANHGSNYFDGHVFMGAYQTRCPDATEVAARAAGPYARFA